MIRSSRTLAYVIPIAILFGCTLGPLNCLFFEDEICSSCVEKRTDDLNLASSPSEFQPAPDMHRWIEQPTNQTLEYGERLHYKVNISEFAFEWRVSDEIHFSIGDGLIVDNFVLPIGEYLLGIMVWDISYDLLQAWIYIIVRDSVIPVLSSPSDVEMTQGEQGKALLWTASDSNPSNYRIVKNGFIIEQGDWTEPFREFEISLNYISVGTHTYTLTVVDFGGNSVSDTARVYVNANASYVENTSTTASSGENIGDSKDVIFMRGGARMVMELYAVISISGLIVLVSISILLGTPQEFTEPG
ncbi:MAG: hypothetical protein JSW61_07395 [Candidatus Thorarchaeota archaeon]|nr:MAG: hypothetical protein JSW61_07395 [Candidatus Thorarchaeota archaeon]